MPPKYDVFLSFVNTALFYFVSYTKHMRLVFRTIKLSYSWQHEVICLRIAFLKYVSGYLVVLWTWFSFHLSFHLHLFLQCSKVSQYFPLKLGRGLVEICPVATKLHNRSAWTNRPNCGLGLHKPQCCANSNFFTRDGAAGTWGHELCISPIMQLVRVLCMQGFCALGGSGNQKT